MRRALSLLGARGVVVVGIVVLVLAVVGLAKLSGSGAPRNGPRPEQLESGSYVDPNEGDDGVAATPTPTVVDDPAARAVATDFTTAWLMSDKTPSAWYAGLLPYATEALAESLKGVDPGAVPATRLTGTAKVTLHSVSYAEVSLPVDSGVVHLSLVQRDGRWLVDGVDWDRP